MRRARGMRGTDLTDLEHSYQLKEWLDLSIQKIFRFLC